MGNAQGTGVSEEERRRSIKQMDQQMNIRFGRTSKHKCERSTGKTMLTKLLSGGIFDNKYTPSKASEVEKVSVPWAAGAGEDVDLNLTAITDAEKKRDNEGTNSLKIAHEEKNRFSSKAKKSKQDEDSKVYDGCNGVVVMVNPTKEWTFSYAKDLLEGIPETIEVLVLANFRDCMEQWVTPRTSMQEHVAGCGRQVHYCECCLANMFGMPAVEAFLRVCLFSTKMEDFKRQAEGLEADTERAVEGIATLAAEQEYEAYPLRSPATDSAPADPPGHDSQPPPADSTPPGKAAPGRQAARPGGNAAGESGDLGGGGSAALDQAPPSASRSKSKKSAAAAAESGTGGKEAGGGHGRAAAGRAAAAGAEHVEADGHDAAAGFYSDDEPAPPARPSPKSAKAGSHKGAGGKGRGGGEEEPAGRGKGRGNALAFWDDEDLDDSPPAPASPPQRPSPSAAAKATPLKFAAPPTWGEPAPAPSRVEGEGRRDGERERGRDKPKKKKDTR